MKKWKAFEPGALSLLLSRIRQDSEAVDGLQSAASTLGEDLVKLAQMTGSALDGKADKATPVACTILSTGWKQDSSDYPFYYDIPAEDVTQKDRADVTLAISSLAAASRCGLCPTCETLAGRIRLRAMAVPETALGAEYKIDCGKES